MSADSPSPTASSPALDGPSDLLVACLCAAWCRTCDTYRDDFATLRQAHPGARFLWVDIEDDAELVDDLEVETFPTLLIGRGEQVCFIGPVLPGPAAAQRLIQAVEDNPAMRAASPTAPAGSTAAAQALLSRLRQSC
ncbi:thioredoxin family protein [Mitsuaria sp. GD03876]|uniref:thioredoxin family protein n=1 Tax=Mitsuaria sp. GD03876 TaxID=2975399 RepID=UPI00244C6C36|nr:thioredoxin family protein [Mitsuaria sp. GD03876]MDH0867433.1 thioredoxin family protein [Mitsuaria sp. GD03876]